MITPAQLLYVTIFLSAFMLVLLVYTCFLLFFKNRTEKEKKRWLAKTDVLITKTIFYEDEPGKEFFIPINTRITALLKRPGFRQTLIDELVVTSKNLAGVSAENLSRLYKQLNLHKDSQKSFQKKKWHKKAKAIQELATMHIEGFPDVLFELSNHKNEYIRMEAQTSIVKFQGFEGLSFLNEITYPISEWHQINLLKELSNIPAGDFLGIENWLKSKNDTVIIFALKLSASYHQFQLYDNIVECLSHTNPKVRFQAIKCLREIYEDTTAFHLMKIYNTESKKHQLEILSALQEIASPESISFLERQLYSEDNQIKVAAIRALFNIGEEGSAVVDQHPKASQFPLDEIIKQIKMESKR